jgi:hypothetical protein
MIGMTTTATNVTIMTTALHATGTTMRSKKIGMAITGIRTMKQLPTPVSKNSTTTLMVCQASRAAIQTCLIQAPLSRTVPRRIIQQANGNRRSNCPESRPTA